MYCESIDGRMPEEFPFTHIPAKETFQSRSFFRKRTYFCIADGDKNQVPTFLVVSQAPQAITCLRQQNFLQFHFCIVAPKSASGTNMGTNWKFLVCSRTQRQVFSKICYNLKFIKFLSSLLPLERLFSTNTPLLTYTRFANFGFLRNW